MKKIKSVLFWIMLMGYILLFMWRVSLAELIILTEATNGTYKNQTPFERRMGELGEDGMLKDWP